jgi:hypothetical protein
MLDHQHRTAQMAQNKFRTYVLRPPFYLCRQCTSPSSCSCCIATFRTLFLVAMHVIDLYLTLLRLPPCSHLFRSHFLSMNGWPSNLTQRIGTFSGVVLSQYARFLIQKWAIAFMIISMCTCIFSPISSLALVFCFFFGVSPNDNISLTHTSVVIFPLLELFYYQDY